MIVQNCLIIICKVDWLPKPSLLQPTTSSRYYLIKQQNMSITRKNKINYREICILIESLFSRVLLIALYRPILNWKMPHTTMGTCWHLNIHIIVITYVHGTPDMYWAYITCSLSTWTRRLIQKNLTYLAWLRACTLINIDPDIIKPL